jgi:hypothetical protein
MEISIVMPCLDEAATVQTCVRKARACIDRLGVAGEVIVADNGSRDGSRELAFAAGARVIEVAEKGYGSALLGGIRTARGRFVIMGDADDSYDFSELALFVEKLRGGCHLVMGNRFCGGIAPGAMPFLHRYLGNPVLTYLGQLFFRIENVGDFHCGLRGFNRDAILKLGLHCDGMEFASELVVKSALAGLRIEEVPVSLRPDGRGRPPHLRTWLDGWRHLRFLLLYSPRWLFLYPGIMLLALGVIGQGVLVTGPVSLGAISLDVHTMLYAAAASVIGLQMVWFSIFSKHVAIKAHVLPPDERFVSYLSKFTLERGAVIGSLLVLSGLAWSVGAVVVWGAVGFGELDPHVMMRATIPATTIIMSGGEIVVASFFLGLLGAVDAKVESERTSGGAAPSAAVVRQL